MNIYMNLEVQNQNLEVFEIEYIIFDKKPTYTPRRKSCLKIRNLLGFIQIFWKLFAEISRIIHIFQDRLTHFSPHFPIFTKNLKPKFEPLSSYKK